MLPTAELNIHPGFGCTRLAHHNPRHTHQSALAAHMTEDHTDPGLPTAFGVSDSALI